MIKAQRLASATPLKQTVQGQLIRYIAEVEQSAADDALDFWTARRSSYKLLEPLGVPDDCPCLTGLH